MHDQLLIDINKADRITLPKAAAMAIDGLAMEFGVYRGYTIREIASVLNTRTVYGFDGFKGLPEKWNALEVGHFATEIPQDLPKNVELVVGWFEDTLPKFMEEHTDPVAFIHIDCDLYSSTKTVFKYTQDRMQNGTIICFDELINYNGDEWLNHEYKAFKEFLDETKYGYECVGTWGVHQAAFKIIM